MFFIIDKVHIKLIKNLKLFYAYFKEKENE